MFYTHFTVVLIILQALPLHLKAKKVTLGISSKAYSTVVVQLSVLLNFKRLSFIGNHDQLYLLSVVVGGVYLSFPKNK